MHANITFPYTEAYMWHLDHTAPSREHRWGQWEFVYNGTTDEVDAWIVWQSNEGLATAGSRFCPPNKTVLVLREPPDIIELPPDYVRQFAWVLAPDERLKWHKGHLFRQFGQNWHIERDYDELMSMSPPAKPRFLSTVISSKSATHGHKQRFTLSRTLKQHFGDQFDHFGRGVNPIKDKWDAVAPYRYHLVMENGQWPHYWTEKLADAFLAWCLPLYVGDPKIGDYFDWRSLIILDPNDPDACIAQIERAIREDAWSNALPFIAESRQRILNQYHLYKVWHDILEREPPLPAREITLRPASEFAFPLSTRLRWRARNAWKRVTCKVETTVY